MIFNAKRALLGLFSPPLHLLLTGCLVTSIFILLQIKIHDGVSFDWTHRQQKLDFVQETSETANLAFAREASEMAALAANYSSQPCIASTFRLLDEKEKFNHHNADYLVDKEQFAIFQDLPLPIWLRKRFPDNSKPLVVTIIDNQYRLAVANLIVKLDQYGLGKQVLVICLDIDCLKLKSEYNHAQFFGGLIDTCNPAPIMHVVAVTKFTVIRDIFRSGYKMLFIDIDVYFSSNPFVNVPTEREESTYDMKFGRDGALNLGYMYGFPTNASILNWDEGYRRYQATREWDQVIQITMYDKGNGWAKENNITIELYTEKDITPVSMFNWQLWMESIPARRADLQASFAMHMTCIARNEIKMFYAKKLGYWQDVNSYYTRFPTQEKLLRFDDNVIFTPEILPSYLK
jgi:hypothetical protein